MLKSLKKNQIIIYVIALMLVTAGYLNYTANDNSVATSTEVEEIYQENLASIGDATLVSSNAVTGNETSENTTTVENQTTNQTNVNVTENQVTTTDANAEVSSDDYFEKSKLERDTMYSQMLETYQNIVNSNTVSDEQRNIATQEITNINNTKNKIMICENLLNTKGFENNIVFVNGASISVVVGVESDLTPEQVAQIQNIVAREMAVEVQNINITQK